MLGIRVLPKQGAKSRAKGLGSSEGQGRDELQREPDSTLTSHRHQKRLVPNSFAGKSSLLAGKWLSCEGFWGWGGGEVAGGKTNIAAPPLPSRCIPPIEKQVGKMKAGIKVAFEA